MKGSKAPIPIVITYQNGRVARYPSIMAASEELGVGNGLYLDQPFLPHRSPNPLWASVKEIAEDRPGGRRVAHRPDAPPRPAPQSRADRRGGWRHLFASPEEAARILGVSTFTLFEWRVKGEGPPWTRVGGSGAGDAPARVRYRRTDLAAWANANGYDTPAS
jgi:hypothetical protein